MRLIDTGSHMNINSGAHLILGSGHADTKGSQQRRPKDHQETDEGQTALLHQLLRILPVDLPLLLVLFRRRLRLGVSLCNDKARAECNRQPCHAQCLPDGVLSCA
jgi:hypothetical protein